MNLKPIAFVAGCLVADGTPQDPRRESDKNRMQGNWKVVALQFDGKKAKLSDAELQMVRLSINGARFTMRFPPGDLFGSARETQRESEFLLDETKTPRMIDLTVQDKQDAGKKLLGIYELDGDTLRICFSDPGGVRPTEFATKRGSGWYLVEYRREKP